MVYKTFYEDYVQFADVEGPNSINDYVMLCSNDRLVAVANDKTFETLVNIVKSLTGDDCDYYRIPKPIDNFLAVLPLQEFSPFVNAFSYK